MKGLPRGGETCVSVRVETGIRTTMSGESTHTHAEVARQAESEKKEREGEREGGRERDSQTGKGR